MILADWIQLTLYLAVLLLLVKPLGTFMAHVYQGQKTFVDPVARPAPSGTRRGQR